VFALADVTRPAPSDAPVLVLALAAQFAVDAAVSYVRNCYGLGVPARQVANALKFAYLCDPALAPIGLSAVLAVPGSPAALLFLLPPTSTASRRRTTRTVTRWATGSSRRSRPC